MEIFESLNPEQKEAVKTLEGPVLILAGAGSGKTKTLTHRVAYLISQGVRPENILAVTFTNKAAEEMASRLKKLLKSEISLPWLGTFHSLGVKILKREIQALGFGPNFVIYDEEDALGLAKEVAKELNLSIERFKPSGFLNLVSKEKSELRGPEEFEIDQSNFYSRQAKTFYEHYQKRLKQLNACDFDDLLMFPVRIFRDSKQVLEKYQNQFKYILVDEYQDTNHAQYCLINLLAKKHHNLFIIGDPDQAIYGWRGADFRNILNFEKDWPESKIIKLEQNYRSTQNILTASHEIISKNIKRKEKTLWTQNPQGALIEIVENPDERIEAELIINKIKELYGAKILELNEMVIMYRTNAQSRVLEEACLACDLPYQIIGGVKFYQRKEIKDILAYLRFIQNPADDLSLERIAKVLGKKRLKNFRTEIEKIRLRAYDLGPSDLIKTIVKKTDYYTYLQEKFPGETQEGESESELRIKNVKELTGLAQKYDEQNPKEALSDFLIQVALMEDTRKFDAAGIKKLNLMTIHSAKGLEFEGVFIVGLEEGLLPHARSIFSQEELEEERRLCYVGFTRAKKYLWLSFVKKRTLWGETNLALPSRFIAELPENLVKFRSCEYDLLDDDLPEINLE